MKLGMSSSQTGYVKLILTVQERSIEAGHDQIQLLVSLLTHIRGSQSNKTDLSIQSVNLSFLVDVSPTNRSRTAVQTI